MVVATASAAARSLLRSSALRKASWRLASRSKPSTSHFRSPSPNPQSHRIFRYVRIARSTKERPSDVKNDFADICPRKKKYDDLLEEWL